MRRCPALCFLLLFAGLLAPAGVVLANPDLAKARNCLTCHAVDRKLIGPGFKDVAARYASDPAAAERLTRKVQKGGGGVWGNAVMPPNPQLSEAEAKQLVGWILGMK